MELTFILNWLNEISRFLKTHHITSEILLIFSLLTIFAFLFSLREFISWLTKTSRLSRELKKMRESQKILEQKIDILMTLNTDKIHSTDQMQMEKTLTHQNPNAPSESTAPHKSFQFTVN